MPDLEPSAAAGQLPPEANITLSDARPGVERITGQLLLSEQANYGVRHRLDALVSETREELRTRLGQEEQLTAGDWRRSLHATNGRDRDAMAQEWSIATKALNSRLPGDIPTATDAYIKGDLNLAAVAPKAETSEGLTDVPALNAEDLQNLTRLILHEGFAELSENPIADSPKLAIAVRVMRDASRVVPDFDPEQAGFQSLMTHAVYYRAAYPQAEISPELTRLVRDCYYTVREIKAAEALEQLKNGTPLSAV